MKGEKWKNDSRVHAILSFKTLSQFYPKSIKTLTTPINSDGKIFEYLSMGKRFHYLNMIHECETKHTK